MMEDRLHNECRLLGPGHSHIGKQGLSYAVGITCDHSENGKLVVTITAAFSARSAIT